MIATALVTRSTARQDGVECVEIALTQGRVALIDAADAPLIADYTWRAVKSTTPGKFYARAGDKIDWRKGVYLHRLILGAPAGVEVDHRDGNTLDCRRGNLRLATRAQNARNQHRVLSRHGLRGVSFHRKSAHWVATIKSAGVATNLGYYAAAADAAHAYDYVARRLFYEFASPNFPDETNNEAIIVRAEHGLAAHIAKLGGQRVPRFGRGSNCTQAILTEADIPVIRCRAASGESRSVLGKAFGVSSAAIGKILNGKSWRHVAS